VQSLARIGVQAHFPILCTVEIDQGISLHLLK